MNGIIYKTTNNIDYKIYIGYHTKNDSKYLGSGKYFMNALKKYGKNNFTRIIIDYADNMEDLSRKEIFWIKFYDARNPEIGYNILEGGEGTGSGENSPNYGKIVSKKTRERLSLSRKGKSIPIDVRNKISISLTGRTLPEETKKKISDSLKGKKLPPFSNEHRKNISLGKMGKKASEEARKNISLSLTGKNNPLYGKHHSQSTLDKMRQAKLGKPLSEKHKMNLRIAQRKRWNKNL